MDKAAFAGNGECADGKAEKRMERFGSVGLARCIAELVEHGIALIGAEERPSIGTDGAGFDRWHDAGVSADGAVRCDPRKRVRQTDRGYCDYFLGRGRRQHNAAGTARRKSLFWYHTKTGFFGLKGYNLEPFLTFDLGYVMIYMTEKNSSIVHGRHSRTN